MNELLGELYIAGQWNKTASTFQSRPHSGTPHDFSEASVSDVDRAATAAECAFPIYSQTTGKKRAEFLRAIAEEIDLRGDAITAIAMEETALPEGRLTGERGRTTGQLKLFADFIEAGRHLEICHDPALPDKQPLPRPDLRRMQRPIGPVAVFGASNFPLAFSVAGGDTASALAAGCPVVVRAHPAHPGTSELVARAIAAAAETCGMPNGVFSLLQGSGHELGAHLVQHPLITAVGFTGSLGGGRALFDLCAARAEPIPFYGEMGSVNPAFLLPAALRERTEEIATGWLGSLTMGVGQFCTNPGILVLPAGDDATAFEKAVQTAAEAASGGSMLTPGIAKAYHEGLNAVAGHSKVRMLTVPSGSDVKASPAVGVVDADTWLKDKELQQEVFGPFGLIVEAADADQIKQIAAALEGQLTCTLLLDAEDHALAADLLPLLERKAGRLLVNGFPTGVEVCDAMVHGGPYPASTNFGATSVGTLAIRRFLRPVCYQNLPDDLLPPDLKTH